MSKLDQELVNAILKDIAHLSTPPKRRIAPPPAPAPQPRRLAPVPAPRAPTRTEIPDDTITHLTDNSASVQILDTELVTGGPGSSSALPSDFDQADQIREQSSYDPRTGQVLSDLDQMTVQRHLEDKVATDEAEYVRTNPPSSDRGVIGGTAMVRPNQANNALRGLEENVAFWPGEDIEATIITITVQPAVLPAIDGGSTNVIRPMVHISWGCRGAKFSMDVDVGTGVQLAIAASSAYVSCYLAGGSTLQIQMFASICFETASVTNPPTYTAYYDAQGAGAGNEIIIARPLFAQSIVGFMRSDAAAQYTLNFYDNHSQLIGSQIIGASTYLGNLQIFLPNDTAGIGLVNNAVGARSSRLMFGLL